MRQNDELWAEENAKQQPTGASGSDLRSVGISPGDIDTDLTAGDDIQADLDAPEGGEDIDIDAGADAGGEPEA